jgi:hypothetical protein
MLVELDKHFYREPGTSNPYVLRVLPSSETDAVFHGEAPWRALVHDWIREDDVFDDELGELPASRDGLRVRCIEHGYNRVVLNGAPQDAPHFLWTPQPDRRVVKIAWRTNRRMFVTPLTYGIATRFGRPLPGLEQKKLPPGPPWEPNQVVCLGRKHPRFHSSAIAQHAHFATVNAQTGEEVTRWAFAAWEL